LPAAPSGSWQLQAIDLEASDPGAHAQLMNLAGARRHLSRMRWGSSNTAPLHTNSSGKPKRMCDGAAAAATANKRTASAR